jgi:hypothetical protein
MASAAQLTLPPAFRPLSLAVHLAASASASAAAAAAGRSSSAGQESRLQLLHAARLVLAAPLASVLPALPLLLRCLAAAEGWRAGAQGEHGSGGIGGIGGGGAAASPLLLALLTLCSRHPRTVGRVAMHNLRSLALGSRSGSAAAALALTIHTSTGAAERVVSSSTATCSAPSLAAGARTVLPVFIDALQPVLASAPGGACGSASPHDAGAGAGMPPVALGAEAAVQAHALTALASTAAAAAAEATSGGHHRAADSASAAPDPFLASPAELLLPHTVRLPFSPTPPHIPAQYVASLRTGALPAALLLLAAFPLGAATPAAAPEGAASATGSSGGGAGSVGGGPLAGSDVGGAAQALAAVLSLAGKLQGRAAEAARARARALRQAARRQRLERRVVAAATGGATAFPRAVALAASVAAAGGSAGGALHAEEEEEDEGRDEISGVEGAPLGQLALRRALRRHQQAAGHERAAAGEDDYSDESEDEDDDADAEEGEEDGNGLEGAEDRRGADAAPFPRTAGRRHRASIAMGGRVPLPPTAGRLLSLLQELEDRTALALAPLGLYSDGVAMGVPPLPLPAAWAEVSVSSSPLAPAAGRAGVPPLPLGSAPQPPTPQQQQSQQQQHTPESYAAALCDAVLAGHRALAAATAAAFRSSASAAAAASAAGETDAAPAAAGAPIQLAADEVSATVLVLAGDCSGSNQLSTLTVPRIAGGVSNGAGAAEQSTSAAALPLLPASALAALPAPWPVQLRLALAVGADAAATEPLAHGLSHTGAATACGVSVLSASSSSGSSSGGLSTLARSVAWLASALYLMVAALPASAFEAAPAGSGASSGLAGTGGAAGAALAQLPQLRLPLPQPVLLQLRGLLRRLGIAPAALSALSDDGNSTAAASAPAGAGAAPSRAGAAPAATAADRAAAAAAASAEAAARTVASLLWPLQQESPDAVGAAAAAAGLRLPGWLALIHDPSGTALPAAGLCIGGELVPEQCRVLAAPAATASAGPAGLSTAHRLPAAAPLARTLLCAVVSADVDEQPWLAPASVAAAGAAAASGVATADASAGVVAVQLLSPLRALLEAAASASSEAAGGAAPFAAAGAAPFPEVCKLSAALPRPLRTRDNLLHVVVSTPTGAPPLTAFSVASAASAASSAGTWYGAGEGSCGSGAAATAPAVAAAATSALAGEAGRAALLSLLGAIWRADGLSTGDFALPYAYAAHYATGRGGDDSSVSSDASAGGWPAGFLLAPAQASTLAEVLLLQATGAARDGASYAAGAAAAVTAAASSASADGAAAAAWRAGRTDALRRWLMSGLFNRFVARSGGAAAAALLLGDAEGPSAPAAAAGGVVGGGAGTGSAASAHAEGVSSLAETSRYRGVLFAIGGDRTSRDDVAARGAHDADSAYSGYLHTGDIGDSESGDDDEDEDGAFDAAVGISPTRRGGVGARAGASAGNDFQRHARASAASATSAGGGGGAAGAYASVVRTYTHSLVALVVGCFLSGADGLSVCDVFVTPAGYLSLASMSPSAAAAAIVAPAAGAAYPGIPWGGSSYGAAAEAGVVGQPPRLGSTALTGYLLSVLGPGASGERGGHPLPPARHPGVAGGSGGGGAPSTPAGAALPPHVRRLLSLCVAAFASARAHATELLATAAAGAADGGAAGALLRQRLGLASDASDAGAEVAFAAQLRAYLHLPAAASAARPQQLEQPASHRYGTAAGSSGGGGLAFGAGTAASLGTPLSAAALGSAAASSVVRSRFDASGGFPGGVGAYASPGGFGPSAAGGDGYAPVSGAGTPSSLAYSSASAAAAAALLGSSARSQALGQLQDGRQQRQLLQQQHEQQQHGAHAAGRHARDAAAAAAAVAGRVNPLQATYGGAAPLHSPPPAPHVHLLSPQVRARLLSPHAGGFAGGSGGGGAVGFSTSVAPGGAAGTGTGLGPSLPTGQYASPGADFRHYEAPMPHGYGSHSGIAATSAGSGSGTPHRLAASLARSGLHHTEAPGGHPPSGHGAAAQHAAHTPGGSGRGGAMLSPGMRSGLRGPGY